MNTALVLLCAKVFFSRILDVSLSTVRTILSVKGKTLQATVIGFFEVLIWFLVVREALATEAGGFALAVAYAGGFAAGTFLGGTLAERFLSGSVTLQAITSSRDEAVVTAVQAAGFAVSVVNVNSSQFGAEKYLLISVMPSRRQDEFSALIQSLDPQAFLLASETKYALGGFPAKRK